MGRAIVMTWVALANDLPTRLSEEAKSLFKMLMDFMTGQLVQYDKYDVQALHCVKLKI